MKVAQYVAKGEVGFTEVPDPIPGDGQVLIKIAMAAICGSDIHNLYHGPESAFPKQPGSSGHECVGTVVSSKVPGYEPGARFLVIPPDFDGWSEYLSVDPHWLIPIPDSLSMDQGVLAQLLGCVIWALKKVGPVYDKDVVVIGQGPAGILFSKLLSNMGAKRVIGLDLEDHRLSIASRMGATHTINARSADVVSQVEKITDGNLADLVVEAVGLERTVNLAIQLGKPHAELMLFGVPRTSPIQFNVMDLMRRQQQLLTVIGTQAEPGLRSFHLAMDMIADNRVDVRPLISHHLPFDDLPLAFDLANSRIDQALKIIVEIDK